MEAAANATGPGCNNNMEMGVQWTWWCVSYILSNILFATQREKGPFFFFRSKSSSVIAEYSDPDTSMELSPLPPPPLCPRRKTSTPSVIAPRAVFHLWFTETISIISSNETTPQRAFSMIQLCLVSFIESSKLLIRTRVVNNSNPKNS